VVGYSGALLGADTLTEDAVSKPPILLVHGQADEVVPAQLHAPAVQALKAAGFDVQAQIRPGLGHGIDPQGLLLGGHFLAERFAKVAG
jgi:phospholipase/carboxylesterase